MARFDDVPLPYSSNAPMPNRQPTLRSGGTVKRSKTLTRPERHVAPVPLINPAGTTAAGQSNESGVGWWTITSWILTFYIPNAFLKMAGIKDAQSRQAWREKMSLVTIACILGGFVGFFTMGLQSVLCPGGGNNSDVQLLGANAATLSIAGYAFNISDAATPEHVDFFTLSKDMPGQDITSLFARTKDAYPSCTSSMSYASMSYCGSNTTSTATNTTTCVLGALTPDTLKTLKLENTTHWEGYTWGQVSAMKNYVVIDGLVLNMNPYINAFPSAISNDTVDAIIRHAITAQGSSGKDVTRQFYSSKEAQEAVPCLTSRYLAGRLNKMTPGCFVASLFLYVSLIVILAVVLIRVVMACIFSWFISSRLVATKSTAGRSGVSPSVLPEGANVSVHNQTGTAPWAQPNKLRKANPNAPNGTGSPTPIMSLSRIGNELFTVCLITCYSEGEEGIRGTLESIAGTTYPDKRKLIWIVCDGMITGAGEKASTPDICVGMLEADPRFGNPQPMGYIAVGSGKKRENRAMVYAGHYVTKNGHRTPTVIVVKCGMPSEASEAKPGNRGKRDSQLILMNFFSRVTYNDRMTPLDYDLFRKVHTLMGVTPDFFEICLMVDADTVVYPDSLTHLVNCMANDNMVMGVCGETRIANKRQSWVTMIQVYEYYISHHHVKAFESVFGGVTCLPGCFSMYRIKARKDFDNDWVPILVKPEIVREYSQCDVVTLHQKNLLLLGEDRFLSTIMLRTFPNRRNVFLPQARCRTIAPDTFSVLLSQRRRWINSTVHNLMELVLVRDLCGTFCFSMQFVVGMDLVGTVVLPIAICLTGALIINSILTPPQSFQEAIPLMLLGCVLGLPALLIIVTTHKFIYVAWMGVYLLALPIWNFVLPVYSFWHFDDFSWGETRKVEGEVVDKAGHGPEDGDGAFEGTTIPLRRWDDWERSRLRKIRREEKRRRQMERMHGRGFYGENGDELSVPDRGFARSEYDSDAGSIMSSEEDVWGGDVGGYDENHPSYPPPPMALSPETQQMNGQMIGMDQMANILDQGFHQPAPPNNVAWRPDRNAPSPLHRNQVPYHPGQGSGISSPANADYTPRTDQYARSSGSDKYSPRSEQYASLSPTGGHGPMPGAGSSSAVESHPLNGHARQRSGGDSANGNGYGPLGPLSEDGKRR